LCGFDNSLARDDFLAMKRVVVLWGRIFLLAILGISAFAQLTRVANTTLQFPANPPQRGYALQQIFGRAFTAPVALATPPGETNRIFVVEKVGTITIVSNIASATPAISTFLDIRTRVLNDGEQGLLGLAFHPNFAQNGYFFVFYTTPGTRYDRLARYQVSATNPNIGDPASELILINQPDEAVNHNAGDLHFGPDGYLYVSLGDEGNGGDSFQNSQRINKDFFSGVLRIDVDKRPGNLAPNPHPASSANYSVPADNPFVGATSFNGITLPDPTKVHTEFWAVGLRNPWRFSFDPATGELWLADVGQDTREEVDIIVKGGNYGWNYREGTFPYTGTPPAGFKPTEPVYDYGRTDGFSVTGGRVYRGSKISALYGSYVFADYGSGNVWSMRTNSAGKGVVTKLLTDSGIAAFGVDPSNGDLLVCDVADGWIRRLTYSVTAPTGPAIPATLADTGAFSDPRTLSPFPGIVPYEINVPFWSDGATKQRWFSIPNVNSGMGFDPTNTWLTPTGTVWIKHFEINTNLSDPTAVRRLETRFLVRNTNGVYGVTYRWTNATSAVLVPEEGMDEPIAISSAAGVSAQVWHYPSRAECLTCHNSAAGFALGFNAPQMNRDMYYGFGTPTTNQLLALAHAGYFTNGPVAPQASLALRTADDAETSLEWRVRSYLAANCAQCHRPGGLAIANFDARIGTPTDFANLLNGALVDNLGDPANKTLATSSPEHSIMLQRMSTRGPKQMPPIASNIPDQAGANLLRDFVVNAMPSRLSFAQWQSANFADPSSPQAAPGADPDSDGASNLLEYLATTDPLDPSAAWKISASATGALIKIEAVNPPNRAVIVEAADSLAGPWTQDLQNNNPTFPAVLKRATVFDLQPSSATRYYRARIMAP